MVVDDDDDVDDDVDDTTNTITVIPGSLEGAPGTTASLAVAAGSETVRVTGSSAFTAAGGTVTGAGAARTIRLPNTAGDYSLTVSASGYDDSTIPVTVTAAAPRRSARFRLHHLEATHSGYRPKIQMAVPHRGALTVTLSGAAFVTRTAEILNGSGNVAVTLPTAAATYTLIVSADRYGSDSVKLTVGAGTRDPTPPPADTAGEADSIEIDGQRRRSGTVNEAARLRVRVLDANDNGVSDVRVTFRVLAPGRGRLSQRGNGRATQDQTDRRGYASANLTPLDDGDIIVRANAAGFLLPSLSSSMSVKLMMTTQNPPLRAVTNPPAGI